MIYEMHSETLFFAVLLYAQAFEVLFMKSWPGISATKALAAL